MASEYNFRCAAARKRRDGCQQARRRKVGKEGPCACSRRGLGLKNPGDARRVSKS